ncbi:gamma-glutamyltranspeptidase / glutathione hydrolase / leukotriene-C4 hydrolase [Pancytospora philotis]|nr:gamma-glutamyltranspeptidase / glutathione hydrolase / leukotriene-C4 hydrolase [Pancytospora philotis]
MRHLSAAICVLAAVLHGGAAQSTEGDARVLAYHKYAANSESRLCSQVGARIMKDDGNAMDAAVATAVCIGIVNSFSSGLGGGGFLMVRSGKTDFDMFDFRETAPAGTDAALLRDTLNAPGMAVGTPGELLGLYEAHKKYGRLPWKRLFEENIKIARNGFKAQPILVHKLERNREAIMGDEGFQQIFVRNGELIAAGDLVVRANLARTLEQVSADPLSFYSGSIAKALVAAVRARGGVLSESDLAEYSVKKRDVLASRYRGYDVYTTSLPTAGVLVIEALKILERIDFDALRRHSKTDGLTVFYHILIEIFKFTTARRGELGDPDFMRRPELITSQLMSNRNADALARNISPRGALSAGDYGQTCLFCEDHGTTHLNVIDEAGMVVQITSTVNLEFGAKFMDPVTGIVLNNQLLDFYLPRSDQRSSPSDKSANLPAARKRPFSSIAPILLVGKDEIFAIGAAGGTRIPTAITGAIAYLSLGLSIDQAVDACRIHNQLQPLTTFIEPSLQTDVKTRLERIGQQLELSAINTDFTSVQIIQVQYAADGQKTIRAVSDKRKHGGSVGA